MTKFTNKVEYLAFRVLGLGLPPGRQRRHVLLKNWYLG